MSSSKGSDHTADLMMFQGRKIVWGKETKQGKELNVSQVKDLTGGETIPARAPYAKEYVNLKTNWLLLLQTNHLPKIGSDKASWRRILLIPFDQKFVKWKPVGVNEHPEDPQLPEKLEAEKPGILAWMVEGAIEYYKKGLQIPGQIVKATAEYWQGEDMVGAWLDERCSQKGDLETHLKDLFDDFTAWNADHGGRELTDKEFIRELKQNNVRFLKRSNRGVIYQGAALKESWTAGVMEVETTESEEYQVDGSDIPF